MRLSKKKALKDLEKFFEEEINKITDPNLKRKVEERVTYALSALREDFTNSNTDAKIFVQMCDIMKRYFPDVIEEIKSNESEN